MSDNDDLLGDDLGDQSLADYNLGNEEEEQLLADDYESGTSQNVPPSVGHNYGPATQMISPEFVHNVDYSSQSQPYSQPETECVVPNITVEVPNRPTVPEVPTYAPYEPAYEAVVPPAIPASPIESPQIVPSEVIPPPALGTNGDLGPSRERFTSERPIGVQRTPQIRDIPDSLDKVYVPRGGFAHRGRTSWRNPQFNPRYGHPYRRNNMQRGNFLQRPSFPPPRMRQGPPQMRHELPPMHLEPPQIPHEPQMHHEPPQIRHERPQIRDEPPPIRHEPPPMRQDTPQMRHESPHVPHEPPQMRHEPPQMRHEPPQMRHEPLQMRHEPPQMRHDIHRLEPPQIAPDMSLQRPPPDHPMQRQFRPEHPMFNQNMQRFPNQPNFGPNNGPMPFIRPQLNRFGPPMREIVPNNQHLPQIIIRQPILPNVAVPPPKIEEFPPKIPSTQQEVRMLPVQLPSNLPPGGLAGKKVLINPHFKGNIQPPVEGLTYIPTRIHKSPPLSPTLEKKFGPIKDIDDAAERFIAEQRNALARAANRKIPRRSSPQRFIENTTIEIKNDLAGNLPRRRSEDELLRRQEEFINANRAGLRRRMRSPSPARRSPSPRRRASPPRHGPLDEESEYKRRLREQENLRERVLRAKEVRRRKNAAALQKQIQERERERLDKDKPSKPETIKQDEDKATEPPPAENDRKPDSTTVKTPERNSPKDSPPEINSTENLTPPRETANTVQKTPEPKKVLSPERDLTPPLPLPEGVRKEINEDTAKDSDDDLDLILDDIEGILSDEEDSGRFKEKAKIAEPVKPKPQTDLRSKLPPKNTNANSDIIRPPKQRIVFNEEKDTKTKEKTTSKRSLVTSSTNAENNENVERKQPKIKPDAEKASLMSRTRLLGKGKEQEETEDSDKKAKPPTFSRRVVLQRKTQIQEKSVFQRIEIKTDPTKPNPGIFSRAVRTAIGADKNRIVIKKHEQPQIEYELDSDADEEKLLNDIGNVAMVTNLPHGMTDTRLKTLAGNDVQNLNLDKEERSAKITFRTTIAAETFRKKFNNKMVAASRLTVILN